MESKSWVAYVPCIAIEILLSARQLLVHPHSTPNANANDNPKLEVILEIIEREKPEIWSLGWIP